MAMDFSKSKNADNLKKIQKKSLEQANKITALDLPVDMIDENEDNQEIFNMNDIEHLAGQIENVGFAGAIEVYKKADGRYEVSSGHRRLRAMKQLGRTTIPCIVKEMPDDLVRAKKLLASNIENRRLTPLDMARAIAYYRDHRETKEGESKDAVTQEIAEFFNISRSQVFRYQSLLQLIPELQEMANDEQFPFSAFNEAATGLNEDGQKELYRQLKEIVDSTDENDGDLNLTRPRIQITISNLRSQKRYSSSPMALKKCQDKLRKKEEKAQESTPPPVIGTFYTVGNTETAPVTAKVADDLGLEGLEDAFSDGADDAVAYAYDPDDTALDKQQDQKAADSKQKGKAGSDISSNLVKSVNELTELIEGDYELKNPAVISECISVLENVIARLKVKLNA